MTVIYTCPNCSLPFSGPEHFIAHRFHELATWFDQNGETDTAISYMHKNPDDYQVVNGLIEKKVP